MNSVRVNGVDHVLLYIGLNSNCLITDLLVTNADQIQVTKVILMAWTSIGGQDFSQLHFYGMCFSVKVGK